ncbi:synaptonemal complex protein 3-like [Trichechus inunguis]
MGAAQHRFQLAGPVALLSPSSRSSRATAGNAGPARDLPAVPLMGPHSAYSHAGPCQRTGGQSPPPDPWELALRMVVQVAQQMLAKGQPGHASRLRAVLANQRCTRLARADLLLPLPKSLSGASRSQVVGAGPSVSKQNLIMASTGRKGVGRPRRRTMQDPKMGTYDKKEKVQARKTPVTDKNGRKRPYAGPVEEEVGDEVQNMLERFGADIKKALIAKRRFDMNTSDSVKSSNQKIEHVWKTQKEQWQKLTRDYSQQFLALFQQCHTDIKRVEEQEVKLIVGIRLSCISNLL